jgi:TRAP-type C4-dicarboxylate transport system permease small subunit
MVLNPKVRKWLLVAAAFLVVFISYMFVYFGKK